MNNSFKIVKIIDEYQVIINGGSNHGVNISDNFQILDEKGSEVTDPETGEVIGHLDLIKDTIQVANVFEKMSICENIKTRQINVFENITKSLIFTEKEKLNVDLTQVSGGFKHSDAPIQIGDIVNKI